MAQDLNRVTLVGRLTRDPEVRQTAGGTSVCSIRLAVTSRVNRGGEWGDQSNYFDVTAFGRTAESAGRHLAKGRRVGVDGRLSWREWVAGDGARRQAVEVIAGDLFYLDPPREHHGGADTPSTAPNAPEIDPDEIPF